MTDTNALGTKDGTSVVSNQSALKEAIERVSRFADDLTSDHPCAIAMPSSVANARAADLRNILATLSSQAESLEAMASALHRTERDYAELRASYDAVVAKLSVERAHGSKQYARAVAAEAVLAHHMEAAREAMDALAPFSELADETESFCDDQLLTIRASDARQARTTLSQYRKTGDL